MQLELRFVFDCETMKKVLQYRTIIDEQNVTNWKTVPTVYGVITYNDEVVVSGDSK